MAAGTELTPASYIQHHLTFFAKPLGEGEDAAKPLHAVRDPLAIAEPAAVAGEDDHLRDARLRDER